MSGEAHVHYGQIYVESADHAPDLGMCFGGQRNGLCGAAMPGVLFMITGRHTGTVGFTVEVHESPPPPDDRWEEVVEVSYRPRGEAALVTWGGEHGWPLELAETDYRVRYCGSGMDAARAQDSRWDDEPEVDRYLLQFWPAPPEADRIVKETSEQAAYWHAFAREQPPPPPPPTPEEIAEAERLAAVEREREAEEASRRRELKDWGGRLPSERLRQLRGEALTIVALDRDLAEAIAATDPAAHKEIAYWVIRRVLAEAQLTGVGWIADALSAVERGEPLPFGDREGWDHLLSDPDVPRTLVTTLDRRYDNALQQAMAFPALLAASEEDPLRVVSGRCTRVSSRSGGTVTRFCLGKSARS
ncbi:hypothetical protein EV192_10453 [Actinocrispum wychmicini]|uniref:Uncharacterized protein n=2 Tax=Actinocrispum wychmicini TaxID=1213861 RepID=A0A4R2JHA1_9PSEU|nr:hypothetical protein EV192_10453 [Actinocrispum wychmicini]